MPVPVFVYEIFCWHLADGSEPLRAPWPHPDEVSSYHWIPGIAQPVNSATFEHDEPVFHHVHFDHAQRGPRLVDHRVHCAVETHLIGEEAFDLQGGIVSERMRGHRIFARNY